MASTVRNGRSLPDKFVVDRVFAIDRGGDQHTMLRTDFVRGEANVVRWTMMVTEPTTLKRLVITYREGPPEVTGLDDGYHMTPDKDFFIEARF